MNRAILILTGSLLATPNALSNDVVYYNQYENIEQGWRACGITSIAMMLDHFSVPVPKDPESRTPDYVFSRFGIRQQPEELAAIFNVLARQAGVSVRDHFYENGSITQLREHLKSGHPAMVHGWFTESGHILIVTNFDGAYYTVNDPAGKWNLGKHSQGRYSQTESGQKIKYPASEFEHAINDNGRGNDLWLHIFLPSTEKDRQ
ncbi:C39 family peptidase [Pseudoalteromonas pernae]|uniref:C39 family peptidase n=1 Tax=Pseudoalteromonas pernae TaxID=3118054 RepID=UPI003242179B